ncbi:hypothetical protein BDP81DRAFT_425545, partial [Colletotrichum phormii]
MPTCCVPSRCFRRWYSVLFWTFPEVSCASHAIPVVVPHPPSQKAINVFQSSRHHEFPFLLFMLMRFSLGAWSCAARGSRERGH